MADSEPPIIDPRPRHDGKPMRIIATRWWGEQIIAHHPEVSADLAVYIDCRDVLVMSSPVIDELLAAWPHATPVGANEDVLDTWRVVADHRRAAKGKADHG